MCLGRTDLCLPLVAPESDHDGLHNPVPSLRHSLLAPHLLVPVPHIRVRRHLHVLIHNKLQNGLILEPLERILVTRPIITYLTSTT